MLDTDEGSRKMGEFAIGTNYEITKFTKNTLFDEKIGGTCHMAVGAGLGEAGGKNQSGIHWDMVCDLKKGGEITADGIRQPGSDVCDPQPAGEKPAQGGGRGQALKIDAKRRRPDHRRDRVPAGGKAGGSAGKDRRPIYL